MSVRAIARRTMAPVAGLALVASLLTSMASVEAVAVTDEESAPPAESTTSDTGSGGVVVDTEGPGTGLWVVQLENPSLATYDGGIDGLAPTSPQVTGADRLDVTTAASVAYLGHLAEQQAEAVDEIGAALDRSVDVEFRYRNVVNGIAVRVDDDEAETLADLPGVAAVYRDVEREPLTDVSHDVIGSPAIWNGETGTDVGTRGEGVVVGIIDSGINPLHPSFAATDSQGYTHTNPYGAGTYTGVCDPGHAEHEDICNDKLIGAWNFHPTAPDAQDDDDHGSHVAGTVAGNVHDATFTVDGDEFTRTVQGVAPHANVISYLVCSPSCPATSSVAAVEQAIADEVDVLNYSISGAVNPWMDMVDRAFLEAFNAGIFVAAAAGNDGPGPSTTAHVGPWNAAVAATTMSRGFVNLLDVTGPGSVPEELTGLAVTPGDGTTIDDDIADEIVDAHAVDPENANGCAAFPAGAFEGALALIDRGTCSFTDKVNAAEAAGATGVVVSNDVAGPPTPMGGLESTNVPAVMIEMAGGTALRAYLADNGETDTTVRIDAATEMVFDDSWPGIVAGFSSRGPARYDVATPTFAAPGVNVLAAAAADGEAAGQYAVLGGTSMASPHAAGSGALMAALHPDWSPAKVLSALATTADPDGIVKEDGTTPADAHDIGAGQLDLAMASRAGLVLDESHSNFLAANPAAGGDPTTLNVPFVVTDECTATCTFVRTVENVADVEATYSADTAAPADMSVTVSPQEFTLVPGAAQTLEITVDARQADAGVRAFGEIRFTTEATHANGQPIAEAHLPLTITPIAVESTITLDPARLAANQGVDDVTSQTLTIGNSGNADLTWSVFADEALRTPRGQATAVSTGDAPTELGATESLTGQAGGDVPPDVVIPDRPTADDRLTQTLTHSQSQAIVATNSVACGPDDGATTSANGFLRTYTLTDFGIEGDLDVTEVEFGIEAVRDAAADVTVNVYTMTDPGTALTYDNLDLIGTATETLDPQRLTLARVPVTGTAPAGSTLVVEVAADDLSGVAGFWPGSNNAGQSAPSYIRSAACGMAEPTDLAGIGFPDVHLVMNVTGEMEAPVCAAPGETTWFDLAPTSGTVAAAGTQDVEVTFDSTGLGLGVHEANLCLRTNDGRRAVAVVPLTLDVAEHPDIDVAPESLDLTQNAGVIAGHTVTIGNAGAGALEWEAFTEFAPGAVSTPLAGQATPVDSTATVVRPDGDAALGTDANEPADGAVPASAGVDDAGTDTARTADDDARILSHSSSQTVVTGNSVACSPDGGATTSQNSYLRTFTLTDFGISGEFHVSEVAFGVENVTAAGFTPTVNLYALDGALAYANLTELGSAEVTLEPQSNTVVTVPVRGAVPADATLVVEVVAPDIAGAGAFFIGSNGSGQTAPSYLSAAGCGLPEPTDTAEVGRPDMHIVMSVTGSSEAQVCVTAQEIGWLSPAPDSGTVEPGGSADIAVTVDTNRLAVGVHTANLCIASNDPDTPVVAVPVTLTVDDYAEPHLPAHVELPVPGQSDDTAGNAVAFDGDTAVVGAYLADVDGAANQGAAHVYTRTDDGWVLQETLVASDGGIGTLFGHSVAIDGDRLVVGALGRNVDGVRQAAAYVYVRDGDGWTLQDRLSIDEPRPGDFGKAVALDGDSIIVGAPSMHIGDNNVQGTAYAFTWDGTDWGQAQQLLASDGGSFDNFGTAIAVDGSTAVVTASAADSRDFREGAAYVFERTDDGWTEQAKLAASDGGRLDEIGASVTLDGDTILVGGPLVDVDGTVDQGAAYLFGRSGDGWVEQAKLTADGAPADHFGASVSLSDGTAVVGASHHGAQAGVDLDRGSAFVFTGSGRTWSRTMTLVASDSVPGDRLGSAVAVAGDDVLVGAPGATVDGHAAHGTAYVFTPSVPAPVPPRIGVTADAVAPVVAPDGTAAGTLTLTNGGEQELTWRIGEDAPSGILRPTGAATQAETTTASGSPAAGMAWTADDDPAGSPAATGYRASAADLTADDDAIVLTHSASMDVLAANTVSCASNADGTTRENHGLRTFTLTDFGVDGEFQVSDVTFGVESVSTAADLTVNLYTLDGPLAYLNLTRLATADVTLQPQGAGLVTVPISATVPTGETLVMEVVTPDLDGVGRVHLGSNDAGQTAPSYISSSPCGHPEPVTYESLGFGQVQLVMAVSGVSVEPVSCELPEWLAVDPASGAVAPGADATVGVAFDAAGLEPGEYAANLCVTSNDPAAPNVVVPVTLTVADEFAAAGEGRRTRNVWYLDLSWTGAPSAEVDVYRNDELVGTAASGSDGTGSHTDTLGRPAPGETFTYRLCAAGADPGDETGGCTQPLTFVIDRRGQPIES